jgi:hypothetical protein
MIAAACVELSGYAAEQEATPPVPRSALHCKGYSVVLHHPPYVPAQMHRPLDLSRQATQDKVAATTARDVLKSLQRRVDRSVGPSAYDVISYRPPELNEDAQRRTAGEPQSLYGSPHGRDEGASGWGWLADSVRAMEQARRKGSDPDSLELRERGPFDRDAGAQRETLFRGDEAYRRRPAGATAPRRDAQDDERSAAP